MTWLILSMFLTTSYHESYQYDHQTFQLVKQLSLLAVERNLSWDYLHIDYSWCSTITNYYWDADYFAFENLCDVSYWLHRTQLRYITIIDIEAMEFFRVNESQF